MDGVIGGIVAALITGGLGYLGVRYKTKKDNEVKPKDPIQILLERYDTDRKNDRDDIAALRTRVEDAETKAQAAEDKVDEMLAELRTKEEEIDILKKRVANQQTQYNKLLKRFNALKLKYEKKDKDDKGV